MPTWDADLYLRFGDERTQPARDLLARVALPAPRRIIDLGCGPGNSTEPLRQRWPEAQVTGLDSSAEMIAKARSVYPHERWVQADIASWQPAEPCDLLFSNATLHWLPDHRALLPRLFGCLAPGGALAVQMPARPQSALHEFLYALAAQVPWRERFAAALAAQGTEMPATYYEVLAPRAARLEMWVTEYQHILAGPAAVVDWIRGTGLRPFLEALSDEAEKRMLEAELQAAAADLYPFQRDGRVLFPFRRLFIVAYRPGLAGEGRT